MRCLRLRFKHISGCLLALLSLNLVGAYGAEEKPVSSPSEPKAMEFAITPQVDSSTLTSVNALSSKSRAKKRKEAASFYQDEDVDRGEALGAKELEPTQTPMDVDVFSELVDGSPVVFVPYDSTQFKFSIPWIGSDRVKITVHSWNDEEEEFNREALDDISLVYSRTSGAKPILSGVIRASGFMNSFRSDLKIMITNSNPEEGFFMRAVRVVVLGPDNINNIVLIDGNDVDNALKQYLQHSPPKKKGKSRKEGPLKKKQELLVVASNPKKPHVLSQLPNALVMTKENILENTALLERFLKPKDEPADESMSVYTEARFRNAQWDILSGQLASFRIERENDADTTADDETDTGFFDWLKYSFSPSRDELTFLKGTEDAFVDPFWAHTVLGPVKTTNQKVQGIFIEPMGDFGSDLANSRFVHINPANKQLLVNLYGHHFPFSQKGYFKVRWIREAEHFATSHIMVTTPEVLKKPLMIFDLSTGRSRRSNKVDIARVMQEITVVEGLPDAVVVVVGNPAQLPVIRRYLNGYTSLFFSENDEPRLEYLKMVIRTFTGTKTVRKPYPGDPIFWEDDLGLEGVSFSLATPDSLLVPKGGGKAETKKGFKHRRLATP